MTYTGFPSSGPPRNNPHRLTSQTPALAQGKAQAAAAKLAADVQKEPAASVFKQGCLQVSLTLTRAHRRPKHTALFPKTGQRESQISP